MRTKTCLECAATFEARTNARCCSSECSKLNYMRRMRGNTKPWLPIAPILPVVEAKARQASMETNTGAGASIGEVGVNELARRIAFRIGAKDRSIERLLNRLREPGRTRISMDVADKLAIGMGLHPLLIWGDEWIAGVA